MFVGVVSDTHNKIENVQTIINIFNQENVDVVIHTGDISKPETLRMFSGLDCPLMGVFGNNDRVESGLKEVCNQYDFNFKEPPFSLILKDRKIVIFHEPEIIQDYLRDHSDVELVIHGHTHRYREENLNNVMFFNPGESAGFFKGKNAIGIINLDNLYIRRIFF